MTSDITLIDRLRAMPTETEWFEFKRDYHEPQLLGEYLCALANAACLSGQARVYLAFGIDDKTHEGGGIKRMFETQRRRSFPLPDYDLTEPGKVAVTISGRILDERYTRLLMERTDLHLWQVMLLDRLQKKQHIGTDEHRRLKAAGLVEGRYPNLMVAGQVARAVGDKGRHIRERGFDKQYYLDIILALVREHGPVNRNDVNEALLSKLPDRLTDQQKLRKVHNLLQELRRSGWIVNRGTRSNPGWVLADTAFEQRNPSRKTNKS